MTGPTHSRTYEQLIAWAQTVPWTCQKAGHQHSPMAGDLCAVVDCREPLLATEVCYAVLALNRAPQDLHGWVCWRHVRADEGPLTTRPACHAYPVTATEPASHRVRVADDVMLGVRGLELNIPRLSNRHLARIDLIVRKDHGRTIGTIHGVESYQPRYPAVPDGYEFVAFVRLRRGTTAIFNSDIEVPSVLTAGCGAAPIPDTCID